MIDRWFFEMLPVKVWFEEQGMRFSLLDAPMQLAVQSKVKLLTAVLHAVSMLTERFSSR